MYMLRLISAVLHERVGPAVSEAALDLRAGELAVVVPLVALLLGLSAWPNAISGHAFGVAKANAAIIESSLVESAGGGNELVAATRTIWHPSAGPPGCQSAGESYLGAHPSVNGGTVVLPCEGGGRIRLRISGAAGGGRGVNYSWSER
jgi:hypothetical protein